MAIPADFDNLLLRSLRGELQPGESAELDALLARDPAAAARAELLRRTWSSLELAPSPAFQGLPALLEKLRAEERAAPARAGTWARAGAWARGGAWAALLVGMVAGYGLGVGLPEDPEEAEPIELALLAEELDPADWSLDDASFAEEWWLAAEDDAAAEETETP